VYETNGKLTAHEWFALYYAAPYVAMRFSAGTNAYNYADLGLGCSSASETSQLRVL